MEGKVNYTVVGVFVIVLTALLFALVIWLTAYTDTEKYKTYVVYVHEDVTGLTEDSPVRFNGVQVGFVKSIKLDSQNARLVRLQLEIEPQVRITTSTYAMLNAQGITGVIYVNLKAGSEEDGLLKALPGQPYPVIPSKPSLLMQLSAVLPEVTNDLHHLSSSLAQVFDKKNRQSISDTLQNTQIFTKTLSDNSDLIEKNLMELHKTLSHLSVASKELPGMIHSIQGASNDLAQTVHTINNTAHHGDVAITNFSNQILPNAQQAVVNFQDAIVTFNEFMSQLQENPSMLIRGKRRTPPGPGE